MATKVDFKHELRQLYGASREPQLVDVPVLNYLMIDGHGDPNTAVEYRQAVEALYALSYAAKFLVKGRARPRGLWRATAGRAVVDGGHVQVLDGGQVGLGLDHDDHAAGRGDSGDLRAGAGEDVQFGQRGELLCAPALAEG